VVDLKNPRQPITLKKKTTNWPIEAAAATLGHSSGLARCSKKQ